MHEMTPSQRRAHKDAAQRLRDAKTKAAAKPVRQGTLTGFEAIVARLPVASAEAIEAYERNKLAEERKALWLRRKELLESMPAIPLDDAAITRVIKEDYRERPAMLAVKAALSLKSPTRYLLLTGGADAKKSVGVGKTTAAAHALVTLGGGQYVYSDDLAPLASSIHRDDRAQMSTLEQCRCLVIDELGIEASDARRRARDAALFRLVDRRQGRPKLTIMITNLHAKTLMEQFDPRLRSRLQQAMHIEDCSGLDMRRGT
jgi:DNA replication protein DnaC